MLKKILTSPLTALATLAIVLGVRVADPAFIESVRLRYFDTVITSTPSQQSQQIHVVNIDDESLQQYGQFPFPRGQYANIIADLYKRNAGLVVFNIYMPDADRFGQDQQLASLLKQMPVVLPQAGSTDKPSQVIPFRPGVSVIGGESAGINYPSIQPNVASINASAAGIGVVNTLPEIDGVTRRVPMVVQSNGQLYPSISLETLRVASGDPSFQVKVGDLGVEAVRIPKFGKINTDNLGRIWVDWSSKPREHSLARLPKDFEGGIVIVGLTAKGLNNPVGSSVGAVYPHYLQAAVLDTIISGVNIERPDYADGAEILVLLVSGLLIILLSRWTYVGIAVTVFLCIVCVPVSFGLYDKWRILSDTTAILGGLVLVSLHTYGVKFVSEFLQKQQIKRQFGSYVNPTVVEQLQKNPELIKLGGVRENLSIVMTDLRGFTTLGESFGDNVEGLTEVMNRYMTALSVPVLKNNGTLIKFIGDASLHVHGAPLPDANHAKTAVQTALEMVQAIEDFNKELQAEGRPPVGMGAGVNTGETLIGNIGSKEKFGYDVLGDSVSTAARLEGQTKGYGVLCIIGPNTNELVKDEYVTLELDNIAVKGKTVGLRIYVPLGRQADLNIPRADIQMHEAMIELYRQQKFDTAIKFCQDLTGRFNGAMDHYYEIWIERCKEMKNVELPKDWDGIFRATSK